MTTIDQLLVKLATHTSPTIEEMIPLRDAKVLRSLTTGINSQQYITENQSKLLTKILRENHKKMPEFEQEILDTLKKNSWLRKFRRVEQIKKFYISKDFASESRLTLEFTFSSAIRKILTQNSKKIEGLTQESNGKIYHADLSEKNIVALYELLTPFDFDIDSTICEHYNTIKTWSENEVKSQFLLENISHTNFQSCISSDIGTVDSCCEDVIIDRSKRYHYFYNITEKSEKNGENLTKIISNRSRQKIWIDKKIHTLESVVQSLIDLNRLPMMVVFDNYNSSTSLKTLENLSEILENFNINDSVGIYFRLPNDGAGIQFNKMIADKKYNRYLDVDTKVVGVQSGKIPKFFIENPWKPMSVLVIDTNLRHTKTAVYANCCDLIISYSESKPMMEIDQTWA